MKDNIKFDMAVCQAQEKAWDDFKDSLVKACLDENSPVLSYVAEFLYRLGDSKQDLEFKSLLPIAEKLYLLDCLMLNQEPRDKIKDK